MTELTVDQAEKLIKERLSPQRYQHSLGVARVAREMAERYGADPHRAYMAGILHDYAKGIPAAELLKIALANGLITDEIEKLVPDLLHARVGAYLLQHQLGIYDEALLSAVAKHTLGDLEMTVLDKIIYLADMLEPGRDYPGLQRLQCLAERDLNLAMQYGLDLTLRYCLERSRLIHPLTVRVRNRFLQALRGLDIMVE